MPARFLDDILLTEIDLHQLLAIRTAVLAEVDHHPLAGSSGFLDIVAQIEERILEPRGHDDFLRRIGGECRHTTRGQKRCA